jgi:hypothetical protein
MRKLILVVFLATSSLASNANDAAQGLFLKTRCEGKLSSVVLSSLKDAIGASQKFRLVSSLDDDGRFDTVQTIYMMCTENNDVTAVATSYGIAECHTKTQCASVQDGASLNVALCNANLSADCGRALFKGFEFYLNVPNRPPLVLP